YSNLISTEDFGDYSLIMSLYAVIAVFYQSGLQSALSKYYLEEKDEGKRKEIFSTIINSAGIIGLILTVVIFILAGWISKEATGAVNYENLIRIVFAALFFETITFITLHLLRTKELARKVVIYSSFSAGINLILNVYLVYYLDLGIYGIIWAQLVTSALVFVILLPFLRENYLRVLKSDLIQTIFLFSYPLIIAGLLSASVDVIDRFIINHFLGKSEVGIYSFSYRIALVMNLFVMSLRSAWTPYSIRLYNEGNYSIEFGKSLTKIIAASLLIFLIVSIFIDDLFKIQFAGLNLFDPQYTGGIIIIPVILISYIFSGVVTYYSVYPYISGKSIHFLISDLIALVINITMNFILIPVYGIIGAAAATFFSYLGCAGYLVILSGHKIKITYEPLKIVAILFSIGLFYLVSKLLNIFLVDIILFIIAFFLVYRFTGFKLNLTGRT
ncbi:MAG TPA: oligosaccharide flippase family protein, partial [Ignavibacteriaceae bacterium]|nr:oligosaccharide flippase family protein [Ignavibacteriaceae bacterium]